MVSLPNSIHWYFFKNLIIKIIHIGEIVFILFHKKSHWKNHWQTLSRRRTNKNICRISCFINKLERTLKVLDKVNIFTLFDSKVQQLKLAPILLLNFEVSWKSYYRSNLVLYMNLNVLVINSFALGHGILDTNIDPEP